MTRPATVNMSTDLSENARLVLDKRYLIKDESGPTEEPLDMFWRVANTMAMVERRYGASEAEAAAQALAFCHFMTSRRFLPNSPTLMNAGRPLGQLSACFVLPVADCLSNGHDGIYDTLRATALIHQSGGGTGFSFSRLRAAGSTVRSTTGAASGPVSFMKLYDASTNAVKQGGCFVGSTLIATADGPTPIRDLKAGTLVYAWDGRYKLVPCTDSWLTKKQAEVWKLTTDKGLTVFATPDHPFLCRSMGRASRKEYVKLRDLKIGTPLMPLTRYQKDGEWWLSLHDGQDTRVMEHVWMAEALGLEGEHIHHRDGVHTNNVSANLEGLSASEHAFYHSTKRYAEGQHPFHFITPEQRAKGVAGWKEWFYNLSESYKKEYKGRTAAGISRSNKKRIAAGTHNWVTNHPSTSAEIKHKARLGQVAIALWNVMAKGLPVSKDAWADSAKKAGLYNTQRFRVEYIEQLFGSFDKALEYTAERNHRVTSVEFSHHEDVYNVEVPGPHNFVVCDKDSRGVVVANTRRGANMGILRVDHPDIFEFLTCKEDTTQITNFNISVAVTDAFMEAVAQGTSFALRDPASHKIVRHIDAATLWHRLVESAWRTGEPGLFFIDEANRHNPVPALGPYEACNPCWSGETQVWTIDGPVRFAKLAETEADVLVLTQFAGQLCFKMMRRPHRTGVQQAVVTVQFCGGSVRCTPNHKVVLIDNRQIEVQQLQPGDRIVSLERQTTTDLVENGSEVVSVTSTALEDVFNGTVDDTHTYFVLTGNHSAILSANCGEQPLLPYDTCNLGSINVGLYVVDGHFDWAQFSSDVHLATRFLDNVIDANQYVLPEIQALASRIRRIGLGIMGFADALIALGLPYDSEDAVLFGATLMQVLDTQARSASSKLAEQRGAFPEWARSVWGPDETCARTPDGARIRPRQLLRNCNVSTIAPTGTISIFANCSSGIEPLFAVAFMRNQAGARMPDVNEAFLRIAKQEGWYSSELLDKVVSTGHAKHTDIPKRWQRVFVTANEIKAEWHIRMQAAFQQSTDSAISKTINFAHAATVEDVRGAYQLAYDLKCKGITTYRDGSRSEQVLSVPAPLSVETYQHLHVECPGCGSGIQPEPGCIKCSSCGYEACEWAAA